MNDDLRVILRKVKNTDVWLRVRMADLSVGDVFRLDEPDGTPVLDNDGKSLFCAVGKSYIDDNNRWTIEVEPFDS